MNNIDVLVSVTSDDNFMWVEKETNIDLFQYNYYMRFFDITDIKEEDFKNGKYSLVKVDGGKLSSLLDETYKQLEEKYNSRIGKSYLVKLLPQRYPSRQYYESEEYESVISRCYIPILTNDKNSFCINSDVVYPKAAEVVFAENDSLVAIYNFGESEIIYLAVDLIPSQHFLQA